MGAQESKASTLYSLKEVSWEYNSKKQNSDGKSGLSFKLYRAIHKPTGKQASVFIYRLRQDDENFGLRLLQNAVKRIKTIRHPGIIKFLHSQIDESTVFVATEPVTPLARVVDALPGEEICLGLFNVLKAVDFLHTQHLCHNNLQIDAVFVADDARRWVLGGMELVDSFTDPCTEHVSRVHACLPEDLIPPEDLDENLRDLAYPKEVKDSFALGQLIGQIIAPFVAPRTVRAKREKDGELFPWPDLQSYADAMASRNPARRPRAKDVLGSSFFADNLFLDIVERFFKEIRGISPEIKRRKLSGLVRKLRSLPPETVSLYILPLILTPDLFSEPGAEAFYEELFVSRPSYSDDEQGMQVNSEDHRNSRFQPLLSRETYRQYIIPFVSQMLRVRQYHVRNVMLKLFHHYLPELIEVERNILDGPLIHELLLGLEEEDNELYVGSIRALMLVIPRLAERQRQGVPKTTTSPENPTTPTSETQATKTKFDPPLTDIQQSSEDLLQVEAPAVTTAPPTTKSGSDSLKRRPSSASTHSNKNITLPSNASIVMVPTNAEEPTPRVTIEHLIERNVIPHALSVCVSEDLMDAHRWTVLDRLIEMWKRLCVIEAKKRASNLKPLTRSLLKSFHLIIKVSTPFEKTEFIQKLTKEIQSATCDGSTVGCWLPRVIEVAVSFLHDENIDVRHLMSDTITTIINFLTTNSEHVIRRPNSLPRKDGDLNDNSLRARLRRMYTKKLPRNQHHFSRGPRTSPSLTALNAATAASNASISSLTTSQSMGNITDSKKYSVSEDNIARANNTPGDFPGMHIVTRHEKDNGWDFGWDEDFEDEIRRADRRSEHSSVPGLPAALATVDRKISRSASTPSSTTLSSLSGNSGSKDEQKRRQDRREARQLELAILRRQRGSRSASISGDSGSNAQLAALRHSKDGIHLDRAVIEAKLAKIDKQLSSKSSVAVTGEKQGSKSSVVVRKDGDTKVNGKSPNNTTTQPSSGRNSTLMAVAVMQATSDEPNYFQGMEPVYRSPPVVDATTKKMLLEAGNVWKGAVYNNGVEAAPATPPKSEKMKPKPKEERANTKPPVKVKSKTVRVETRLPRRASTGKKSWSPAGGAELADGKIGRPSSAGARPQAIGNTSSRLAMSPSPEGATTATGWGAELGEEFADVEI